ncbi:MAG: hypothetical protein H6722_26355 [Sandaracinus sp.]|nr:hypothetical protein [Sandaracinus sp.]MCB9621865.1 hypothetical protein [Sandaracinus sp.]
MTALLLLGVSASASAQSSDGREEAQAADASQPPLRTLRGGTLGVPDYSPSNAAGLASFSVGSDSSPDLNFFAEAGRLPLSERVALTVLGESLQMDSPIAELSLSETVRPLPSLQKTTFATLGLRLSIGSTGQAATEESFETRVNGCLADRAAPPGSLDDAGKTACEALGIDMDVPATPQTNIAAWDSVLRERQTGFGFIAGFRFMYDTEDSDRSVGVAGELGAQYLTKVVRGFVSASYAFAASGASESDNVRTETIAVHELSVIVSAEARFAGATANGLLAPRVGAYFRYSQNFWDNDFAAPGTDASITGQRFEGGFFAAGHFSGGFSGLISLGIAAPYGTRGFDDVAFVVTVSPMIGRPL